MLLGTGVAAFEGSTAVERVRTSDGHVAGLRRRGRRHRRGPARRTRGRGRLVRRRRDPRRRSAADQRAERVRRRRRRHGSLPALRRRMRVEHWANALHQGPSQPATCSVSTSTFDRLPYFFSDQYDVGMEYTGYARAWDRVVFRGDPGSHELIAFWLARGSRTGGHERRRLGRRRRDRAARPHPAYRSTSAASPTPPCRWRTWRRRRPHEPAAATSRGRRLDLARHALARPARQRRLRRAHRGLRGHRRHLEPDDLRQGDHRLRPLRRAAACRGRRRHHAARRISSSGLRSRTSAAPPTCCAPPTTRAAGVTASSRSSARPTSRTTRRARSTKRSRSGAGSHVRT